MPLASTPWPALLNNSRRTGQGPNAGPSTNTLAWSYQTGGKITAGAAIGADGTIYFGAQDRKVYALNPDGSLKWTYTHNYPIYYASPAIGQDGTIYIGADKVLALNPDGTLKWAYGGINITGLINASPAIGQDGTIYALSSLVVSASDNKLIAIKPSGEKDWEYHTGGSGYGSPALAPDGAIYFGCSDGKLYALNPNGTLKWTYQAGNAVNGSPAIDANGNIYIAASNTTPNQNQLIALSPTKSVLWSLLSGGEYISRFAAPAIASDGTIYQGFYGLRAINPDGTVKWQTSTAGNVGYYPGAPAIGVDGTVYFTTEDHKCYAYSSTGEKRWALDFGYAAAPPIISTDGSLYFGSDDQKFYAIQAPSVPPPTQSWSLFWADSGPADIQTALLSGTPSPTVLISMTYTSYGLAIDPSSLKIYWSSSDGSINIANTDGTHTAALVSGLSFTGYGLGLDLANNLAYCAEPLAGKIWQIDLGNGQTNELISGLSTPVDVALDLANGKIYWVEYNGGDIGCANLDGTGGVTYPVSGLTLPQGIALDADNGVLYWAEKTAIKRANTDGSNVTQIVSLPNALGNSLSRRVALDPAAGKVYWTDRDAMVIQRANMGDVNATPETVLDNLASPTLIVSPVVT